MEDFVADVSVLSNILTNLVNSNSEIVLETKFVTTDEQYEFMIFFVPPKTHHPLRHVVGPSSERFLLVGNSTPEESSQLQRFKLERVLVGSPLSQEVHYLTSSQPLQAFPSSSKENSGKKGCVFDWFLGVSYENFRPVSLESARYFLSLYANSLRSSGESLSDRSLSVWVYVDGNNMQGISYLAVVPEGSATTCTSKEHKMTSVGKRSMRHIVFSNSKAPIKKREDLPDLSSFIKQHISCGFSTAFFETHGYALYDIMGPSHGDNQDTTNSRITVELTWNGVNSLLQPHPHACDGIMHIKSVLGSVHLGTHSLYQELNKVDHFCKMLGNSNVPWPAKTKADANPIAMQMETFFAKMNSSNVFTTMMEETEDEGEGNFAETTVAHMTFQEFVRKDLDFTERLWLVLKDCVDEDDLTTSFQMAISALFNGKCQCVIHSSNMTSLAVFIRDLLQFETKEQQEQLQICGISLKSKPLLDPNVAMKCLIEIGSEKLARDYVQFFIHEELATMGQLSSFINSDVSIDAKVSNIKKLHQTLELVVTARSVTRLEHENLRLLTQSALAHYKAHSDSEHPMFSLSLPAFGSTSGASMKSFCATSSPAVWCVAIKSKAKALSHTTIVQLSTHHPSQLNSLSSPACDVSEMCEEEFDLSKEKFEYFLSSAKQVTMPVVS